jgi:hypothetical protein
MSTFDNDLEMYDELYEGTEAAEGFDAVTDGIYQVNVDKAAIVKSKDKTKTMLKLEFSILNGKFKGQKLWKYLIFTTDPERMSYFKRDMATLGVERIKPSEIRTNLDAFLDLKLEVQQKTKGDNVSIYLNKRIEISAFDIDKPDKDDIPF